MIPFRDNCSGFLGWNENLTPDQVDHSQGRLIPQERIRLCIINITYLLRPLSSNWGTKAINDTTSIFSGFIPTATSVAMSTLLSSLSAM